MVSGHLYLGCSKDYKRRFREHRRKLNKRTHANSRLQNSWNKYGEKAFTFEVIYQFESEKRYV